MNHSDDVHALERRGPHPARNVDRHMVSGGPDGDDFASSELHREFRVVVSSGIMVAAMVMVTVVYIIGPRLCRNCAFQTDG